MSVSARSKSRELGDLDGVFAVETLDVVTAGAAEIVFEDDMHVLRSDVVGFGVIFG
jgi:hypothetical protein